VAPATTYPTNPVAPAPPRISSSDARGRHPEVTRDTHPLERREGLVVEVVDGVDAVAVVLGVAEELLRILALDVAPEREVVRLMRRRQRRRLESTRGHDVEHPARRGDSAGVAAVQIHAVPVDRVAAPVFDELFRDMVARAIGESGSLCG
jgi:hypothetical protein